MTDEPHMNPPDEPLTCPSCKSDSWQNTDGEEGWLALWCKACGKGFKLEFTEE